ncbi:unnamed protein product [Aphis gossypii]|uniref:Uncharacterized protein n=1 Tax=Aphis gossypii TaxID=80765 RepID=A0A9P0NPZ0_APHGO|nr:unnamed protein product [Aphis gossypii]
MYMVYLLYVDDGRRLERCYRHVFRTRWTQQIRRNHGKIIPLHELNTRQQTLRIECQEYNSDETYKSFYKIR